MVTEMTHLFHYVGANMTYTTKSVGLFLSLSLSLIFILPIF